MPARRVQRLERILEHDLDVAAQPAQCLPLDVGDVAAAEQHLTAGHLLEPVGQALPGQAEHLPGVHLQAGPVHGHDRAPRRGVLDPQPGDLQQAHRDPRSLGLSAWSMEWPVSVNASTTRTMPTPGGMKYHQAPRPIAPDSNAAIATDCSARGAALLAARAVTGEWLPSPTVRSVAEPDPARAATWDAIWADYEHARKAIVRHYHAAGYRDPSAPDVSRGGS